MEEKDIKPAPEIFLTAQVSSPKNSNDQNNQEGTFTEKSDVNDQSKAPLG